MSQSQGSMRMLLQGGTMLCVGLWIAALATDHWHVKTYFLGGGFGAKAQLKLNLYSYSWHCDPKPTDSSAWFQKKFCDKPWMTDSSLLELSHLMCAQEEQSFGLIKAGCEKAQIVSIVSLMCLILIALSLLFTLCGAGFAAVDPGGKPVVGLFMSAPIIQLLCLIGYIVATYDLTDFYDPDKLFEAAGDAIGAAANLIPGVSDKAAGIIGGVIEGGGKIAVNDIDESITFGFSFFIAVGGVATNFVLAWCAWLFVADARERENWAFAKEGGKGNGTFQQSEQSQPWDQPPQQGWDQPPQQQWGAAPQQWDAGAPPGQQWQQTTTTTAWHPGANQQAW